jgi:demethylmenaquinone methyltransferase/2-methoxy-6-polyprenyl-1,4-benzoquinol methylase
VTITDERQPGPPRRYAHIGRVYDLISLERPLYGRARRQLMRMLGPLAGGTVVDVGCGTGLNLPGLQRIVGPTGRIVGIDASASMLDTARRRVRRTGWTNVVLIHATVEELVPALAAAHMSLEEIAAVVATFVVSILDDDSDFWSAIDEISTIRPILVALADVGDATEAGCAGRAVLRALGVLGGAQLEVRPWADLAARASCVEQAIRFAGHVHLAVGRVDR